MSLCGCVDKQYFGLTEDIWDGPILSTPQLCLKVKTCFMGQLEVG